ncbi:diacylglycerol kinase [Isoptericola jiangsuensis]|uniref:Diacylglycerol kinase n=1 Tax=Isoptericola jiangsuensis TaxID=548579 RepID=A0A2A9EX98_9MICO|nr:diacylglycerol kinase family protein [Isoptericola jiangsuensis]PFG43196.1 diacylglycerol kinase [Isoptericola jiangsuensis]
MNDVPARRRVGVAVNPTAAGGRGLDTGRFVAARLRSAGLDVTDLTGRDAVDATARATTAVRDGAVDALVVVGGDGMVHVGVQAVAGTGVPLGVVAAGTGNDFAAAHRLPVRHAETAVEGLLAALATGHVRPVDAISVTGPAGGRWVAGAVSAGLDAAVNQRANTLPARVPARYALSALAEIAGFRAWAYDLTFTGVVAAGDLPLAPGPDDTARWRGRAALVTAANIHRIGGGIRVAPDARTDDGLLDVVVAPVLTRAAAATIFPSMFSGRHVRRRDVHVVRARAVTIAAAGPGPDVPGPRATGHHAAADLPLAHGDGEALGPLPVTARAVPAAVLLLATPGAPSGSVAAAP